MSEGSPAQVALSRVYVNELFGQAVEQVLTGGKTAEEAAAWLQGEVADL